LVTDSVDCICHNGWLSTQKTVIAAATVWFCFKPALLLSSQLRYGSKETLQRHLAAMVISLFTEVEESRFQLRLGQVLPVLLQNIEEVRSDNQSEGEPIERTSNASLLWNPSNAIRVRKQRV